ncbi:MAG: DUF1848 domain-containing protein [Alphaproteobacteria bacterium]|nr:DUF1848 domain-containing protein [Alphaproteobacteria bacterium]
MIVSASYRTDIPAFYGDWFRRRLEAGYAMVQNPYGGPPYRVDLTPQAVTGFVFWTRNAAPFAEQLAAVGALDIPFAVQFTLTGYPRHLESSVPRAAEGVRQICALAERYGPRAVVWRYDPLLISSVTDAGFHRTNFDRLAAALEGRVDEVCVSFAQIYAKTRRNLAAWGRRHGETWDNPAIEVKCGLRAELESMAQDHGMCLSVCSQADLGGRPAVCVDAERLADLAGRPLKARRKGNRPGCLCAESRDIGAYDSCPHGCVYCYAVASRARAQARHRAHDPTSEYLLPPKAAVAAG